MKHTEVKPFATEEEKTTGPIITEKKENPSPITPEKKPDPTTPTQPETNRPDVGQPTSIPVKVYK